ncbi:sel1 repeat family protein [uncultured Prevotella sp.]|uniref:sel1 repeat family protein n=1 Tax=uncultured Prevotella sp. TaxID=159272 RepID=UPI0027DE06A9|nr:sel1 repeat family protein [uncultured Prevotella sp.]
MFAKGYTNIRAMIETQYGILSQMIMDIAYRYQTQLKETEEENDRFAQENSDRDYDVYHSILNSLSDVEERSYCLMTESRKILFCAISSYYETMLNEIVLYYKIANNATQPSQILDSILKAYKIKYGEEITCREENVVYANSIYRLLRNLYMHGSLSKEKDRCTLFNYAGITKGLKTFGIDTIVITDNDFLFKALDCFKSILVCIDDAFMKQLSEEQKQLMRAKDIIREAINNYPPEMPGIEDEYPPFCSIRIHRLLCEAESLLLNIAKQGNAEAQMLLADLYISAFETPQKKKGFFWLKKAVAQNYLPAIQMLREVNH